MSKELPYFKFYPTEWLAGRVVLEEVETQGLFINICSYYWHNNCNLPIATLYRRYNPAIGKLKECYNKLLDNHIIELNSEGFIRIKFLDEQWEEAIKTHKKLSESGKKGMKKRWKKIATLLPGYNNEKEKERDKENKREKEKERENLFLGETQEFPLQRKKIKKCHFSEAHYQIAKEFQELKSKTHGNLNAIANANLEAWADEIRKLEELDGKNLELIEKVLSFALSDSFWINNLQSLQGIRHKNKDGISKFEMIEIKSTPKGVQDYELTNSTTEG